MCWKENNEIFVLLFCLKPVGGAPFLKIRIRYGKISVGGHFTVRIRIDHCLKGQSGAKVMTFFQEIRTGFKKILVRGHNISLQFCALLRTSQTKQQDAAKEK